MIKMQRPLEEINFEIKVLKDSVAVLEKKKTRQITQEMYKKTLVVGKSDKSGPFFEESKKAQMNTVNQKEQVVTVTRLCV